MIKKLLLSCVVLFAPIKATLIAVACLVVLDFVLGIIAARKRGEAITSLRMRDTVGKLITYELVILVAFIIQKFIAGPELPISNLANTYVAIAEGTSVMENLNTITGTNILTALIAKVNAFKS